MRCLIGFIFFWIAIGMFISLFIENAFLMVLFILFFLIVGFNMFCK